MLLRSFCDSDILGKRHRHLTVRTVQRAEAAPLDLGFATTLSRSASRVAASACSPVARSHGQQLSNTLPRAQDKNPVCISALGLGHAPCRSHSPRAPSQIGTRGRRSWPGPVAQPALVGVPLVQRRGYPYSLSSSGCSALPPGGRFSLRLLGLQRTLFQLTERAGGIPLTGAAWLRDNNYYFDSPRLTPVYGPHDVSRNLLPHFYWHTVF